MGKCCGKCRHFVVTYFDPYRQIDCGRCEHDGLKIIERFVEMNRKHVPSSLCVEYLPISADSGTDCPCFSDKSQPAKPTGIAAIMGKWPGDETDEQIDQAMKEMGI